MIIAFAGVARSGKDTLAKPLVENGFEIWNFGHPIKQFFAAYIAGDQGEHEILRQMQEANPELTKKQLDGFLNSVLIPFFYKDISCDSFTEDDAFKVHIRPILEHGGDLIYQWVMDEYFRVLDAKMSAGKSVVNTRLVRIPEAQEWVKRGGHIYIVDRKDWPGSSEWEITALETLRESGLVSGGIYNGGTAEEWEQLARNFANNIHSQQEAV